MRGLRPEVAGWNEASDTNNAARMRTTDNVGCGMLRPPSPKFIPAIDSLSFDCEMSIYLRV